MVIKIKNKVKLHDDLKKYVSKEKSNFTLYEKDDILVDVNDRYLKRFSEFPNYIEILEEPKKDEKPKEKDNSKEA